MRLNKYIAEAGLASRRQADHFITEGRVKVNGEVVTTLGTVIDPAKDKVFLNGQPIGLTEERVVYLLNKPKGVVTTADDPEERKTVLDFVPKTPRVFPCGRLDAETMGLVLLTNDGTLCYQLTHPKFEHEKQYLVHATGNNPEVAISKLKKGVELKDGSVTIHELTVNNVHHQKIDFTITIHEGRNRIIRRLCAAVGLEVISLTRTRIGHYHLEDLAPGEYRAITA